MMAFDGMVIDAPTSAPAPALNIHDLLKVQAEYPEEVEAALSRLTITIWSPLSTELRFLKELEPDELPDPAENCGMTIYSLKNSPSPRMLQLEKRESNLFIERDFIADLHQVMVQTWTKNRRVKFILTGNAGIGKSWFQVSLLRRLLRDRRDPLFRFVVRQVGKEFFLADLEVCSGYKLEGGEFYIRTLLDSYGSMLYLYEPAAETSQPPLSTSAASLSTLSPRPARIHEYEKSGPFFLYMPVWEFNELEFIAEKEKMDWALFDDNFLYFGGIIRHTLQHFPESLKRKKELLDTRCRAVTAAVFRSFSADVDDDPNADKRSNISGFIVSYTDIPRDGGHRFSSKKLMMTSEHVRAKVFDMMSLQSPREHLRMLANHLDAKSKDTTGKDLEVSVVHLLAAGPMAVKWEYHAIGGTATKNPMLLFHTKRGINRLPEFDELKVNYPANTRFPLVDCFMVIGGLYWAFQTTWRYDHAFKLATLLTCRQTLGLDPGTRLNIVFVNPVHAETYRKRTKDKYLAKGERLDKPILNRRKEILLDATGVTDMWNKTNIFVGCPKGEDWHGAISEGLGHV